MIDKKESARIVIKECFWGDYLVDSSDIIERLKEKDAAFCRFIFSKIIENCRYPSRHLRLLFSKNTLQDLLKDYSTRCRDKKRLTIIQSNITRKYSNLPELQWKK